MERKYEAPEGLSFLREIWRQEDECEATTDNELPNWGTKAPACLMQTGTVLSLVDRMASCWWACDQGDHTIQYLCGRVESNARAALRLLRFGLYDESLLLCRSLGEIANLLQLFCVDKEAHGQWTTLPENKGKKEFSPVRVRKRLEGLETSPLVAQDRYGLLSELAAHVQPDTKPQSYNHIGVSSVGANLQHEGALLCLNEIARPLSGAATFAAALLNLESDIKEKVYSAARSLVHTMGGVEVTERENLHRYMSEGPPPNCN